MKTILLTTVLLMGGLARADVFQCTFSNPSYSFTYNLAQMQLIINDQSGQAQVLENVSFQIRREGRFELQQAGNILMQLNLNNKGSDGASGAIYPYDASWGDSRGGCESGYLSKR